MVDEARRRIIARRYRGFGFPQEAGNWRADAELRESRRYLTMRDYFDYVPITAFMVATGRPDRDVRQVAYLLLQQGDRGVTADLLERSCRAYEADMRDDDAVPDEVREPREYTYGGERIVRVAPAPEIRPERAVSPPTGAEGHINRSEVAATQFSAAKGLPRHRRDRPSHRPEGRRAYRLRKFAEAEGTTVEEAALNHPSKGRRT